MSESIIKSALGRFKKNAPSYIAVGLLCGLFISLLSLFSFVDGLVFLLTIPLFALPFVFASFIACYYLEAEVPINISNFFRYYFGYFRPQFRGCFKGIKYFLLSLAVYMGGLMVFYLIFCFVFYKIYGGTFQTSLEVFILNYLYNNVGYDELVLHLEENDGLLLRFITYISSFPIIPAFIFFVYGTSFSSLSIYYRSNILGAAPSLIRLGINNAYLNKGYKMKKDWFKLNWPLLVLPLFGAGIAILIYFLFINNITFLAPIVVLGCSASLIFFLPFYFSNMEVIYHQYEKAFKDGNKKAIEMVLARIQSSIELSEEEKRSLEESFKDDGDDKEEY